VNYSTMLLGAAVSAIVAALAGTLSAPPRRQPPLLATMALSALLGPLAWNCILRTTGATAAFSHDLPFKPFPISWQDTGSGIFTVAVAFTALSLGAAAHERARHVAARAATAALAALLVDIYLY